jgi:hypothetical protein
LREAPVHWMLRPARGAHEEEGGILRAVAEFSAPGRSA